MNSNWRNRPTTIDFIDRNRIDAIINIDEREFKNESASIHAKFVVVKMRSIRILLIINLLWLI